jgi:hypothetical protein
MCWVTSLAQVATDILWQTGSGVHSSSHTHMMGNGTSVHGVKWLRCDADHASTFSTKLKSGQSYTSVPKCILMEWCGVTHSNNFNNKNWTVHIFVPISIRYGSWRTLYRVNSPSCRGPASIPSQPNWDVWWAVNGSSPDTLVSLSVSLHPMPYIHQFIY